MGNAKDRVGDRRGALRTKFTLVIITFNFVFLFQFGDVATKVAIVEKKI